MKSEFSTSWKSSKQPRKQRKYQYNAPLHLRHSFLNATLSKDLRAKHGVRALPVRKGDEVKIMRGSHHNKKAKIASVDVKRTRVVLENLTRSKKDGSKVPIYFHPSNLQIVSVHGEDKRRLTQEKKHAPHTKPAQ